MNYIEKKYLVAKMRKELEDKFDPLQIKKRLENYRQIYTRQNGPIDDFYENLCIGLSDIDKIPDPRVTNLITRLNDSQDEKTQLFKTFLQNLVINLKINPSEKMIQKIYSVLETRGDEIVCTNDNLSLINSMSYCCLINDLIRLGFVDKAEVLFDKILDGNISVEEEIIEIISILRKHQDFKGQEMLPSAIDAYEKYFLGGNKEVILDNLRKMLIMVDIHRLKFRKTSDCSHYISNPPTVYLNDVINDEITVFHEFGHVMDEYFSNRSYDESNEELYRNARNKANRSRSFAHNLVAINEMMLETKQNAYEVYDEVMEERYGSKENIYLEFYKYIHYVIKTFGLKNLLESFGVSEDNLDSILEEYSKRELNEFELAKEVYELDKRNFAQRYWRTKKECCVSDIVSAVFKTRNIFINNDKNRLMIAHDSDYYYETEGASMAEVLANYNALKVIGAEDMILMLRSMFGDEFVDAIDSKYSTVPTVRKARRI